MPNSQTTLNEELFSQSVRLLTGRDEHLAEVVKAYGQPPLWVREPGFPTLVYIILEQQVSLASARAAFERLKAAVRPLTPKGFLRLNDAELLRIGFSRQKTLYTRLLAESLARRHFNLRYLHGLPDDSAHKMLMAFKGIGRWTAEMFLIFHELRADVLPVDDIGLQKAIGVHYLDGSRPTVAAMRELAAGWQPYRSVATWYLWRSLDPVPVEY